MERMLPGSAYVFPRDARPSLGFRRLAAGPLLSGRDIRVAKGMVERLKGDPLGDGTKLTVMDLFQNARHPGKMVMEVADIKFSEIMAVHAGVRRMPLGEASESYAAKGVRILLTNNVIVTGDGRIVLSDGPNGVRTPLNGFVDSDTIAPGEGLDSGLIQRAAAIELREEYGIGAAGRHELHSVHITASSSMPLAVRVFGSMHLQLSFGEIVAAQGQAPDAWENPALVAIDNTREAIAGFVQKVPYLGPMLTAYVSRML